MILKDISNRFHHHVSEAFHLAHYHPRYLGKDDEVSNLLLKFKDNVHPWVSRWAIHAAVELTVLSDLDIVVRVLSSDETIATNKISLDILGEAIEKTSINLKYLPSTLSKSRTTKPLKMLKTKSEREKELAGVYSFKLPKGYSDTSKISVLVIDDIVTSGTTLKEVARAISAVSSEIKIIFFALGQTYNSWAGGPSSNDDILTLLKVDRKLQDKNKSKSTPKETTQGRNSVTELEQSVLNLINLGHSVIEILEEVKCSKNKLATIIEMLKNSKAIDSDLHIPPSPNLVFDFIQMGWQPVKGYTWKDKSDSRNFEVLIAAPGPDLVPSSKTPGRWIPREGYKWANPDNPKDISVIKRI